MSKKLLSTGTAVLFRHTSKGKWREGKIAEVDTQSGMKSIYKINAFMKGSRINWTEVLKMCNDEPSGELIDRDVYGWFFVKWFSPKYVKAQKQ